jgi:flagellar M-ring protein FliF
MFAAVLILARAASAPDLALLYSGLEPAAAGDVVAALDAQGAAYEVRGTAIYVDASARDALRLALAGEGLPANGTQGYELLDSLSGFGTTSQMFDAAYWRAKEGELARTIASSRQIASARVHIAAGGARPFARSEKVTAAVTVTMAAGALSASNATALRYLVASSVPGLLPEDVTIIDSTGGIVAGGIDALGAGEGQTADRAEMLRRNAQRILEARVGVGNALVEVSLETITESELITERRFDPEGRVAISTETEERSNSATDTSPSAVTVASNLPDGDAAGSERRSNSNGTETRERTNFEVSETQREVTRGPGDIRRLSVAVLVDGIRTIDETGAETWTPRAESELADLSELVASAVGLVPDRGDTITIKSLEFEPIPEAGTVATAGSLDLSGLDTMTLVQTGVLAIVALLLGLFVLRPILLAPAPARPAIAGAGLPYALPNPATASAPSMALTGEIADGIDLPPDLPVVSRGGQLVGGEDAVARLRRMIEDRQDETVALLRSWMDEPEGRG